MRWNEQLYGGAWVIDGYAAARDALRDPRLRAARIGPWVNHAAGEHRYAMSALKGLLARAMVFTDDGRHRRLRAAAAPAFSAASVQALAPLAHTQAQALLAQVQPRATNGFDLVADFARPLPLRVIGAALGLPCAELEPLAQCCEEVADFIGNPHPDAAAARRAQTAAAELACRVARHLHADNDAPLSVLLRQAQAENRLCAREALTQAALLFFAGQETTRLLLASAARRLLLQRRRRIDWDDAAQRRAAVLEVLRLDAPVAYTGRRARRDLLLHGRHVAAGTLVLIDLAAAQRDPAVFPRPHRFDAQREAAPTLAFGWGPHRCLGAELSLLEVDAALLALRRAYPELRPAGPAKRQGNAVFRGWQTLPVRAVDAPKG